MDARRGLASQRQEPSTGCQGNSVAWPGQNRPRTVRQMCAFVEPPLGVIAPARLLMGFGIDALDRPSAQG